MCGGIQGGNDATNVNKDILYKNGSPRPLDSRWHWLINRRYKVSKSGSDHMGSHDQMAMFLGSGKEAFVYLWTHTRRHAWPLSRKTTWSRVFILHLELWKTNRTIFETKNNKPRPEHSSCYDPKLESCDWLTILRLWKSHIALLSGQALETVSLTFLILWPTNWTLIVSFI